MKFYFVIMGRIVLLIFTVAVIYSCTGKEEKPDSSGIIPEKDFIPILTEIRIADGLLANPKIKNWVVRIDSVSTYYHIIEKHGYSKEAFDKTMQYYFISKPKKLIRINEQILGKLSEMESRLEKEVSLERERASNIWPGERNYYFPDSRYTRSLDFSLSIIGNRVYTLMFTATIYPDDQTLNPQVSAYTYSADSIATGKRTYQESLEFLKDGLPHTYSIRIFVASHNGIILKGNLYENDNNPDECLKHASFENITLSLP
jgi:hypothetical protein